MYDENDIALSIQNLHKDFKLPHERADSIKERILHFRTRNKTYERFHALDGISFDVKRGEFFGIVGRNGSGKSTLLKIIGGIYPPTKGNVIVNGTLTPFIELGIGFSPELTGRDNVFLNGAILGLSNKEIVKKYQEIVDFAELHKFMDQKLKNYSSGMQVRLAFSIAIQAHNDILLIDEVLAVGDANFQRKCFQVFKEIKNQGKTVIFVTHDMGAVQQYCDRALMIQDSKMLMIGKPRDVALRYEIANTNAAQQEGRGRTSRPDHPDINLDALHVSNAVKLTKNFTLEDDILIDVEFTVKNPIETQFNAFFVSPDGKYIAGINTTEDLKHFKPQAGKHHVRCSIKAGQLAIGEYIINVAVYTYGEQAELIDILDSSYGANNPVITILEKSPTQDGLFYINGTWSNIKDSM